MVCLGVRVLCIRSYLRGIGAFLREVLGVPAFGVVVHVMGMLSLVVACLLDVLHLMINTSLGEVAALSLRGAADHVFPFVVLVLLQ
jgi:hypothetical protein